MIRLAIFIGFLALLIGLEFYAPRRKLSYSRWKRWPVNLTLTIINSLMIKFTVVAIAYVAAVSAFEHHWGLLNILAVPNWLTFIITIILLDLAIYGQHIASHKWRWFWRLHKIHHTDLDFDVTTSVRFHPVEIIVSMAYKLFCIYLIGANPTGVIAFEIILSSCALFNHSNINIPLAADKLIRRILVTPDMHRVHHSVIRTETDSNFGFSISIWDRLFKTYTDQPKEGHINMTIGLPEYQYSNDVKLPRLLLMPFKTPYNE